MKCSTSVYTQKWQNDHYFQGKSLNIRVIQVYALTTNAKEAEFEQFYEDLQDILEQTPKIDVPYRETGMQKEETSGVADKLGLGVQNEAGQRLKSFAKRTHWSEQSPSSNNTRENSTYGHYQMVNTEIRLIIFFAAKDGEALDSQQKQDWELTVAQIMNSLLPNSGLSWRK